MMNNKECVIVTGGSGLVGRAISDELKLEKNQEGLLKKFDFKFLSSEDADFTNLKQAKAVFELHKPNYVINLAAQVGGLYANMSDNELFYRVNSKINDNVLSLAREFRVKKCLSCLSTCIFPAEIQSYPLDETKIHLGPPHNSNVGYSIAKRQIDLLNTLYNGLNSNDDAAASSLFTSFIPTNIYGLNDNFNPNQSHVIPGLIYKAHKSIMNAAALRETEAILKVSGSGKPLRQFIYAPDLAKLILWCLENYSDLTPIILCPDECDEISISFIAETIARIFSRKFNNIKMKVEYDSSQSDGQFKKTASNRKLRTLNGGFKFTPLEAGLTEVIDWYCLNYPNKVRLG